MSHVAGLSETGPDRKAKPERQFFEFGRFRFSRLLAFRGNNSVSDCVSSTSEMTSEN